MESTNATPFVSILFRSRDRATSRTYETSDVTNRIVSVMQVDSKLGETGLEIAQVGGLFATRIVLRDHDNTLGVLAWHGYRVDIRWGYNTVSGNRYAGQ